jgi:hypothetical protein
MKHAQEGMPALCTRGGGKREREQAAEQKSGGDRAHRTCGTFGRSHPDHYMFSGEDEGFCDAPFWGFSAASTWLASDWADGSANGSLAI